MTTKSIIKQISLADGKYELRQYSDYSMDALRNGEPWRDLTGDNLIYSLLVHIEQLEDQLKAKE